MIPHLLTLADLSVTQIYKILSHSSRLKNYSKPYLLPARRINGSFRPPERKLLRSLDSKSIALLFSKRSTRTRLAAETSAHLLGGKALFLGKDDIQLGVNENVRDTVRVISGMCQGIFARVGDHKEIEEMVTYAEIPVINALSSLWHPTQVLADLLTLHEQQDLQTGGSFEETELAVSLRYLNPIRPLTVAYVGDSANVLHDMLVTYPRMGHRLRIASPAQYRAPPEVWSRVKELNCEKNIWWGDNPKEAVEGADIVVTDTWVSMGQENEKAERLAAFQGYQVTEELCKEGGAKEDWKFMHCLPRKQDEVDDEVFYGPRSLVFPEADNRKWTIMALFDLVFGRYFLPSEYSYTRSPSYSDESTTSTYISRPAMPSQLTQKLQIPATRNMASRVKHDDDLPEDF